MNDQLQAVVSMKLFRPGRGGRRRPIRTGDVLRGLRFETDGGPVYFDARADLGTRSLELGDIAVLSLMFDLDDDDAGAIRAGACFTLWPADRQGVGYVFRVSRKPIDTHQECEGESHGVRLSPRRLERRRSQRFGALLRNVRL